MHRPTVRTRMQKSGIVSFGSHSGTVRNPRVYAAEKSKEEAVEMTR